MSRATLRKYLIGFSICKTILLLLFILTKEESSKVFHFLTSFLHHHLPQKQSSLFENEVNFLLVSMILTDIDDLEKAELNLVLPIFLIEQFNEGIEGLLRLKLSNKCHEKQEMKQGADRLDEIQKRAVSAKFRLKFPFRKTFLLLLLSPLFRLWVYFLVVMEREPLPALVDDIFMRAADRMSRLLTLHEDGEIKLTPSYLERLSQHLLLFCDSNEGP